ncbi:unnamed protein product [Dovyalis caffra]|uniref:Beta-amylase n=1 Tax=Dovyalis caffra TaxID=77055 RepID=A0AAV1S1L1_9ROSI|nr:unnamed protein product [Dovyalis caffra]
MFALVYLCLSRSPSLQINNDCTSFEVRFQGQQKTRRRSKGDPTTISAGHLVKILEGPKEALIDLAWHPVHLIIISVSLTGLVYIWAKDHTENWSAFTPDFKELEENEEFVERKDEFNLIPETEKVKESDINEDDEVDIVTVEKDNFSDSDLSQEDLAGYGDGIDIYGKALLTVREVERENSAGYLTPRWIHTNSTNVRENGVIFSFTCMEMRDGDQPEHANCSPEGLVGEEKMATRTARIELAGENALQRYDAGAYAQVLATSRSESGNSLTAFTYLRINEKLFEGDNWRHLVEFVRSMSEGGRNENLSDWDSRGTNHYIGFVKDKSVQKTNEAALA